ncbi:MAG: aldehyde dehydrogenase family protein, partial [Firmicutes bacterium]|nr:aldehyde dehydrogenase family protein [Bacillota bacterium]
VVAGIAPWNYPFMMALWKLAPALAAGNTMILKPASLTPITALMLGPLAKEAGIPDGVLNIINGPGSLIGHRLVTHRDVALISLTGDTRTGRKIMEQAAPRLKRLHLELGGKAPFIVCGDADFSAAVSGATVGALVNTGQDCTAATRIYVHRDLFNSFIDHLAAQFSRVRIGDPLKLTTDIGPLISAAQRDKVQSYVDLARSEGARIITGGQSFAQPGYFYEPTIITHISQHSRVVQEEIFGPVVAVLPFDSEEDAVRLANDVEYGLASSVWTQTMQKALRISARLQFGDVWINEHLPLTSEMPHGGVKQSGFGHDLSSFAFEEYTSIKHVMSDTGSPAIKPWHYTVIGDPPLDA